MESEAVRWRKPAAGFAIFAVVLAGAFGRVLYDWAVFSSGSELYSHTVLIPVVSGFLIWLRRHRLQQSPTACLGGAAAFAGLGAVAIGAYWWLSRQGGPLKMEDHLALTMFGFCCFLVGGAFLFFGRRIMAALTFPTAFMVFVIPFPVVVEHWIEIFFQHTSAYAAYLLMALTQTPMVHDGLVFRLPGITISVGQECSGIHSSLVLFITSLLAGQLFLSTTWKRATLAVFVVPLAIARNAIRIVTIALFCVYADPSWIDSALHRRGGPLFFVLSLIPFFALLWWLRRSEPKAAAPKPTPP